MEYMLDSGAHALASVSMSKGVSGPPFPNGQKFIHLRGIRPQYSARLQPLLLKTEVNNSIVVSKFNLPRKPSLYGVVGELFLLSVCSRVCARSDYGVSQLSGALDINKACIVSQQDS